MARGEWTAEPHSWVLGASGYTGRALVTELAGRAAGTGATVTAHLRPERPANAELRARFEAAGASVVECPLLEAGPGPLTGAFHERPPTHLFLVHGTTRRRAQDEGIAGDPYIEIDLGLTQLALAAAAEVEPAPRVVYLLPGHGLGREGCVPPRPPRLRGGGPRERAPFTIARAPDHRLDRPEPRALELAGAVLRTLTGAGARAKAARFAPRRGRAGVRPRPRRLQPHDPLQGARGGGASPRGSR